MAMKETKTQTIAPGTEEQVINLWRSFGWELVGAPQEIYNKDSHEELRGDDVYSVTETTHYVKVTFERDTGRQNYEELKSLEAQYYAIKEPYLPYAPRFITLLWIILIVGGFFLFVIPGIILLILHIILYIKKNKQWKIDFENYQTKLSDVNSQREEILKKAQSLV